MSNGHGGPLTAAEKRGLERALAAHEERKSSGFVPPDSAMNSSDALDAEQDRLNREFAQAHGHPGETDPERKLRVSQELSAYLSRQNATAQAQAQAIARGEVQELGIAEQKFLHEIIADGHAAGIPPAVVSGAAIAYQRSDPMVRAMLFGAESDIDAGIRLTTGNDPRPLRWVIGYWELIEQPGRGTRTLQDGFTDPDTGDRIKPTREIWEKVIAAANGAHPTIHGDEFETFRQAYSAFLRGVTEDRVSGVTTDFLLHVALFALPAVGEAKAVAKVLRVGSEFEGVSALGFIQKAEEVHEFRKLQKTLAETGKGQPGKLLDLRSGPPPSTTPSPAPTRIPPSPAQKSKAAAEATADEIRALEQGAEVPLTSGEARGMRQAQEQAIDAAARRHAAATFDGDEAEAAAAAKELDDLIGRYPDAAKSVAAGIDDPSGLAHRVDLLKQQADRAFRAAERELNSARRSKRFKDAKRIREEADQLAAELEQERKLAAEAAPPPGLSPADARRKRYDDILNRLPVAKYEDDLTTAAGNAEKLADDLNVPPADAEAIVDSGASTVATKKLGAKYKGGKKRYVLTGEQPPKRTSGRPPISPELDREIRKLYWQLLEEDLGIEGYNAAKASGRLPKLSPQRQKELDKLISEKGLGHWQVQSLERGLYQDQIGQSRVAAAREQARKTGILQPLSAKSQKTLDTAMDDAARTQALNEAGAKKIAEQQAARHALRKAGVPEENIRKILGPEPGVPETTAEFEARQAVRKGFRKFMLRGSTAQPLSPRAKEALKNASGRAGGLLRVLTLMAQGDVLIWGPLMLGAALGIDFIGGKIGSSRFRNALLDMLSLEKALEDALRLAEKNPANIGLARDLLTKYEFAVNRLRDVLEQNRRALEKTDEIRNAEAALLGKRAVLVAAQAEMVEVLKPPASRKASQVTLDKIRDASAAGRVVLTDDEMSLIESRALTNWGAETIMRRVKPFERRAAPAPPASGVRPLPSDTTPAGTPERGAPPASAKQVALIEKRVSRGDTELTAAESDALAKWNHSIGKPSFDEGALTVEQAGVILDRPPKAKGGGLPGFEKGADGTDRPSRPTRVRPASLKQIGMFKRGQAEAYTTNADDARVEAYEELLNEQDPAELSEEAVAELMQDPRFLSTRELSEMIDRVENKRRGRGGPGGPGEMTGIGGMGGGPPADLPAEDASVEEVRAWLDRVGASDMNLEWLEWRGIPLHIIRSAVRFDTSVNFSEVHGYVLEAERRMDAAERFTGTNMDHVRARFSALEKYIRELVLRRVKGPTIRALERELSGEDFGPFEREFEILGGFAGAGGQSGPAGSQTGSRLRRAWETSRDGLTAERDAATDPLEIRRLNILIADATNRIDRLIARGQ